MLRFTHLVSGELGSEPRAHYLSITSCPSGAEQPWEREEVWSCDLHSEESTTLLTLVWECISNFPNLPSPLARLFLATFDSLPTQPLGNAEDEHPTVSLATTGSFSTSSLSTLPLSAGLPPFLTTATGRQRLTLKRFFWRPRAVPGSVIMANADLWTLCVLPRSPSNEDSVLQLPGVAKTGASSHQPPQGPSYLERAILLKGFSSFPGGPCYSRPGHLCLLRVTLEGHCQPRLLPVEYTKGVLACNIVWIVSCPILLPYSPFHRCSFQGHSSTNNFLLTFISGSAA